MKIIQNKYSFHNHRIILLRTLMIIVFGVFLFPKIAYLAGITPENIIKLTNEKRNNLGLNSLNANQYLTQAAYNKAQAIFENQNFSHNINESSFSKWIKDTNYKYQYVGENLAIDFITSEGIINAWKNSPTHYKNLVNPKFKEIGVAVLEGTYQQNETLLVVQIFGSPAQSSNIKSNQQMSIFKDTHKYLESNPDFGILTHSQQEYNLTKKNHSDLSKVNYFVFSFILLYAQIYLILYIVFFKYLKKLETKIKLNSV